LQKSEQLIDRIKTLGNVGIKAASTQDWSKAVSAYEEAIELCGECQLSEFGGKFDTWLVTWIQ
jgi:hypothetical protein